MKLFWLWCICVLLFECYISVCKAAFAIDMTFFMGSKISFHHLVFSTLKCVCQWHDSTTYFQTWGIAIDRNWVPLCSAIPATCMGNPDPKHTPYANNYKMTFQNMISYQFVFWPNTFQHWNMMCTFLLQLFDIFVQVYALMQGFTLIRSVILDQCNKIGNLKKDSTSDIPH